MKWLIIKWHWRSPQKIVVVFLCYRLPRQFPFALCIISFEFLIQLINVKMSPIRNKVIEFEYWGQSSFWVCVLVVTCTAQNVRSHASELLSQEGYVGLDDVHSLANSHSGLKQIQHRDYQLACRMNRWNRINQVQKDLQNSLQCTPLVHWSDPQQHSKQQKPYH